MYFQEDRSIMTGADRVPDAGRVAIGLSGGVDSAVAAWLLRERGFDVQAFHLIFRHEAHTADSSRRIAALLGIPLEILDLSIEFERFVLKPFVTGYMKGETPSPCVICNPVVKFGLLAKRVLNLGIDFIATGHYAGLTRKPSLANPILTRPLDRSKDQTYFLCRLTNNQLRRILFPLANWTKEQVRRQAIEMGLTPPRDSQGICFLDNENYSEFIFRRIGHAAGKTGPIVDIRGRELGRHRGLIHYTVGQRKGLGIPAREAYYVLAKDFENNRLVIGNKAQTLTDRFIVRDILFSTPPPGTEFSALVQIRSRHEPASAKLKMLADNRAAVVFHSPQGAIAPGQAAAIYENDILLGGGWIVGTDMSSPGMADG
jgi:tRNA-uridine 2-sulfurtransferase